MNLTLNEFLKLDKNGIPNLLLINASEDYTALISYCTTHIKMLTDNSVNTNRFEVDRYFKFDNVIGILSINSLFSETNYVELTYKTKPTTEQYTYLNTIYAALSKQDRLVIITNLLNKRELGSNWVNQIIQAGGAILTLNENSITTFIMYKLQQNKLSINPNALTMLVQQNEANVTQLMQELEKLILYYTPGHKLSVTDIQNITTDNAQYDIYKLSSAYLSGDLKSSLHVLDNIYHGIEDAILINWILSEDVRKLLKIKSGIRTNNNINEVSLQAGVWKLALQNFITANHRLSYKCLIEILNMLSTLDFIVKGVKDGDAKTQLINILIKFTNKT